MSTIDRFYMQEAIALAKRGELTTSPNPNVGCVIVKNGEIIGRGYHEYAGGPHAEIVALNEAGLSAKDSTMYVTLEPCCHTGRTGPCTTAILAAKPKRVVAAMLDPNPLVSGKGIEMLKEAGIEVDVGCEESAAAALNKIYLHYRRTRRPYVILKWAMSLDGKTIPHPDDSPKITDIDADQYIHQLRYQMDAILIGSRTALLDNPSLTVRHFQGVREKHPLRIVLMGRSPLPLDLKLFSGTLPGKTLLITTTDLDPSFSKALHDRGIEIKILPSDPEDLSQISLEALLEELGQQGITSLLVEGGEITRNQFLLKGFFEEIQTFIAPVLVGSLTEKKRVHLHKRQELGPDLLMIAQP